MTTPHKRTGCTNSLNHAEDSCDCVLMTMTYHDGGDGEDGIRDGSNDDSAMMMMMMMVLIVKLVGVVEVVKEAVEILIKLV